MKKIVSIILALVMILGCCAFAESTVEARSNTLTITVNPFVIKTEDPDSVVNSQTTGNVIEAEIEKLSQQIGDQDVTWSVTVNGEEIDITPSGDHNEKFAIDAKTIQDLLDNDPAGTYTIEIKGSIPTPGGNKTVEASVEVSAVKTDTPDTEKEKKDPTNNPTDGSNSALTLALTADQDSYMEGDTVTITVTPTIAEKAKPYVDASSLTYEAFAQYKAAGADAQYGEYFVTVTTGATNTIVFTGAVGTYQVWAYAKANLVIPKTPD